MNNIDNSCCYCWCVYIDNFDEFIKYISCRFGKFSSDLTCFKGFYHDSYYIYLYVDKHVNLDALYELTYTNNFIVSLGENDNYKYMGEFQGRRNKLEKLNKISNEDI